MIDFLYQNFSSWPSELIAFFSLLVCFLLIILFFKYLGAVGLYIYSSVAIIAANIQVLKTIHLSFFSHPVALGTILFSSTFLCTDILYEFYGEKKAKLNIILSFAGYGLFTLFLLITLIYKPSASALSAQKALLVLFNPAPALFIAGMLAYLISQYHDIWLYKFFHIRHKGRHMWLRNNVSTIISSFIDTVIFSFLAWYVFKTPPLSFQEIFYTYIIGTFLIRCAIALCDTPVLYLARFITPRSI